MALSNHIYPCSRSLHSEACCAKVSVERCPMPILIMGLAALAVFLAIGGLLFVAGMSERRQPPPAPEEPAATRKAA